MMHLIRFAHPAYLLLFVIAVPLFLYPVILNRKVTSQEKRSVALRLMTAVLLILALSGLQIPKGKRVAAVVFAVDRSQSIAPVDKSGVMESINKIASNLAPEDEAGIVVFGKEAVIEQKLQKALRVSEIQSSPQATGTNISKGLNLSRALLSTRPDFSKRIVLLSDGNQTAGDVLRDAAVFANEGIAVDVIPLVTVAESNGRKLFLQEFSGPESIRLGEPFELRISVRGKAGTNINLQRYHNGAFVSEEQYPLSDDQEVFRIPERISVPGFHQYQIKIQDTDESRSEDYDEAGIVVYAYGRTKVLHIAENPARFLEQILKNQGFEVVGLDPKAAPKTVQDFSSYDVVLMDNVSAAAFSEEQLHALTEHVERYSGGLIMVGGSGSFGPGGYSGTTIEKALPVEMALKNREKKPALALVLVLDKSGSMGMEQRKISKLDMAKEAVVRLTELLTEQDALGIIAFDRSPRAVMPLGQSTDRNSVNAGLKAIVAGGGTSILPAVEMAYKWLSSSAAEKKHILLLSDGQAESAERKPLMERVAGSSIVFSTVGVGGDVDRSLLQKLAESGKGRSYFTDTGMELPEIFKREGLLISGKWFMERPFKPRQIAEHEMLMNLEKGGIPEMSGYVAVTPKKLSEILLAADNGDPILACWRYGLGRTMVFASDFSSPWTRQLVHWKDFSKMWTQTVRWASRGIQSESMHAEVRSEAEDAILTIDSFDADGNYKNFMNVQTKVEYPDSTIRNLEMAQIASGKYESRFPLQGRGMYLFEVAAKRREGAGKDVLHFGFDFSKLPEDRKLFTDQVFMRRLAEAGGGFVLNPMSGSLQVSRESGNRDAWQLAAVLALLLFILDLFLRQIEAAAQRKKIDTKPKA
jgi:uncharacterized membrane protein